MIIFLRDTINLFPIDRIWYNKSTLPFASIVSIVVLRVVSMFEYEQQHDGIIASPKNVFHFKIICSDIERHAFVLFCSSSRNTYNNLNVALQSLYWNSVKWFDSLIYNFYIALAVARSEISKFTKY